MHEAARPIPVLEEGPCHGQLTNTSFELIINLHFHSFPSFLYMGFLYCFLWSKRP